MPRNPFSENGIRHQGPAASGEDGGTLKPQKPPADEAAHQEDLGEPEVAEAVGASLEEAIENALEILGAREDEVEIEILAEGRRPRFGLGKASPFRVRVFWREDLDEEVIEEEVSEEEASVEGTPADDTPERFTPPPRHEPYSRAEPEERTSARERGGLRDDSLASLSVRAREVTEDLLRRMDLVGSVRARAGDDEILVDIESDEDDALLIGRGGETRAALQHIVQRLVIPREQRGVSLLLDVNGYWERRAERLHEDALSLARQVIESGEELRTEALSAQERRIVHRALADETRVRTESVGDGVLKRVAILPASSETNR